MDKHRIYGEKADINKEHTIDFYDQRAKNMNNMDCPYTSVLLGDQNPEHAAKWNLYEKDFILPQLNIQNDSCVLDIGCGIGRWAEHVIPLCHFYCGVDFSSGMIQTAKQRNAGRKGNFEFLNYSFQEFVEQKGKEFHKKFNRLIIAGVCMYINDDELSGTLEKLLGMFRENSIFYLTETVGLKQRLTLKEFYSETLKCDYDAIYRTPEEYNDIFKVFTEKGYQVHSQGFLPKLNNEDAYSETDRWYSILTNRTA